MKKLGLLVMPLMAISFLASCGCSNKGPKPTEYITHKFTFHGTNCKINGASEYSHDIYENDKNVQYTITPNTGYELPETIDSNIPYDNKTGVITISEIKSDIELNVGAIPLPPVPGLKHKIHLDPGGGQFGQGQLSILENINDGDPVPNTPVLVREGYDVSKVTWLIDDTTDVFTFGPKGTGTEVRDSYFLHAKWEDKLQVKVNFVETSLKTETFDVPYGERAAYYKPKQTGFNFIDWYDSDPEDPETGAQAQPFKFEDPIKEETNIYAKWEAIAGTTCNVKFNITDCTVTYKGSPVGDGGANIDVPQDVDPYYVKFSVKASESVYKKPSEVTLDKTTDHSFNKDNGDLFINLQSNLNVTGTCDMYKTLEECSWAQIKTISEAKEAPNAFRIGDEKIVKVNNLNHKVRIIGFNHDYSDLPDDGSDPDSNELLGITFEFANVITKSNGVVATTKWDYMHGDESNNYDYRKSTHNDFLNNKTEGVESVINMLPDDLKEVIKQVDKKVGVYNGTTYVATSFDGDTHPYPYLFSLAHDEMTNHANSATEDEGSKYLYYLEHPNQTDCIKTKAGTSGDSGEFYWLRSPYTSDTYGSWFVTYNGIMGDEHVHYSVHGVAPAFCI